MSLILHIPDPLGKQDLIRRRPIVNEVSRWFAVASIGVNDFNPTSAQLFSRIARQTWKALDTLRELDTAQPVAQQVMLGAVTAMARACALYYVVRATTATGRSQLTLSDSGNKALQTLEGFDPPLQGTAPFDVVATLHTILINTRFS